MENKIKIINKSNPAHPPVAFRELKDALAHGQEHELNNHAERHIIAYHDGSTAPISLRVTKEDFLTLRNNKRKNPHISERDLVTVKGYSAVKAFIVEKVEKEGDKSVFVLRDTDGHEIRKSRSSLRLIKRTRI